MKQKLLSMIFLCLFAPMVSANIEFQACKMFIGEVETDDENDNPRDKIHNILQTHFTGLDINGYTIYETQGVWRPDNTARYQTEPTTVVEIIAKDADVPHIHILVLELETQLKQQKILYYCHQLKSSSLTGPWS